MVAAGKIPKEGKARSPSTQAVFYVTAVSYVTNPVGDTCRKTLPLPSALLAAVSDRCSARQKDSARQRFCSDKNGNKVILKA